jgi:arginine-tRNA-protein transferase
MRGQAIGPERCSALAPPSRDTGGVARSLHHAIERPRPCSYLPDETASLEYDFLVGVSPEEYEAMLERGWRRFGLAYFRPACAPCGECVSLRVPVAEFAPSRSQRRAANGGARLRCEVGPVRVDEARLALYAAWHEDRQRARGWPPSPLDAEAYAREFAVPHACARELAYWDDAAPGGPRLVGLGLCDETPRAWSALYFFYAPAFEGVSLGVHHLVTLVELARAQGKAHVYLGYRVSGCPSMRYKAAYRPHELLEDRPGPAEAPRWRPGGER